MRVAIASASRTAVLRSSRSTRIEADLMMERSLACSGPAAAGPGSARVTSEDTEQAEHNPRPAATTTATKNRGTVMSRRTSDGHPSVPPAPFLGHDSGPVDVTYEQANEKLVEALPELAAA